MSNSNCKAFGAVCLLSFAFATLPAVRGLLHKSTHASVTVHINGIANLLCPTLDEVIGMDGTYTHVTWYWKTNNDWHWFVGMDQFGVTQALAKGVNISSDGSLYISKVHLVNVTDFMCRVGRINGRSSVRHFVTVRLRDGSGNKIEVPTEEEVVCKHKREGQEPARQNNNTSLKIVIGVLSALLFVALAFIVFQNRSFLRERVFSRYIHPTGA